ncbi:DUF4238 domain-containing protein [Stenotrophomonas lactitubi]|uniref:DUF4238 domain-containing protein n=1 Tax=Stenotrophomonas lactitubi TaxID=2045214 RepID=UPI001DB71CB2|nr:DUF4238 domain-containing protein [Stenotrophomonas lactitubi]CAH0146244.1 hypothetical protein SRABI35_00403 [Stenotrophomonas lactitubi]
MQNDAIAAVPMPPPVLKGPKRQHYLPRFFLQGFIGQDQCLAVYDRSTGQMRRQQPLNTGAVGHLYTINDEDGRQRFEWEQALGKIESDASRILPILLGGNPLQDDARAAIALFVGTLAVRTPEFIQSVGEATGQLVKILTQTAFANDERALASLRGCPEFAGLDEGELRERAEGLADFTARGDFTVNVDHQWSVSMALPMGQHIAQVLAARHWSVLEAPAGAAFVVSDAPVVLTTFSPLQPSWAGVGFGSAEALVLVPLDSTHALAMYGLKRSNSHRKIDRRLVRSINLNVARHSQRFLLGRDNALVETIARASCLDQTRWTPKFHLATGRGGSK